jgi:VWFA-related protein
MMRNQTILFLTLATISLPAAVTFGQQPASRQNSSQQTPSQPDGSHPVTTLKIKAREVALVTSLKVSDFTLTEDGRPQTVKSFSRESNLPFRVGLLVDTSRSVSGAMDAERKAAGKFVDLMLPADPKAASPAQAGQTQADQAFLIHFDREVELLEDFTNSRDKLHRELDDMGATRAERSSSQGPETRDDDRGSGGGQTRTRRHLPGLARADGAQRRAQGAGGVL